MVDVQGNPHAQTRSDAALVATEHRAEHLELVLAATNTSIGERNLTAGTHRMSERWYAGLGYRSDDPAASDPSAMVHPDDRADAERTLQEHLDGRTEFMQHVLRYRHRDGTWTWHQVRAEVVDWDDAGRPARLICADTDVSELHRLEEHLTHSSTVQALASFSGGIAHDFNNILAIVQGHTEALLHRDVDAAERSRRLGIVLHSVERASSLVKDLMRLTRPDESHTLVVDLSALVAQIAASLAYLTGVDIELTLDLTPDATLVRIDPARLEAIVLNLASNSCDAMPTGGLLDIRVSTGFSGSGDPIVDLDVTDTGVGMSSVTLASIFRPFFSTKPPGAGTGLGLATTYETVHHAGGTITARSDIGRGTTFHIRLPAASASASASASPSCRA